MGIKTVSGISIVPDGVAYSHTEKVCAAASSRNTFYSWHFPVSVLPKDLL